MENDPKAVKVAWTVWAVFVIAYLLMNGYLVKSSTLSTEKLVTGLGIAMPILTNLAWWAVGFRLRLRINHWWAFGFLTSLVVGVAGFMTMWSVAKRDVGKPPGGEPKFGVSVLHMPTNSSEVKARTIRVELNFST